MKTLRYGEAKEAGVSAERTQRVIDLCAGWVADGITPALIALAARRGVIFVHKAWGQLGPQPDSPPVLPDSIFGVASVSKPVAATAVMMLVERGQLGINQPVQKFIPEFKGDGFEKVTLRHLMTHTSGLPYNSDIFYQSDDPFADLGRTGIRLSPDQEMRYSNVGYDVLGEIVARVSKQPFHEFTRANIFEPLGMKDASFIVASKSAERCIQPRPGTHFDWPDGSQGKTWASSTLRATAMDMAIFGQTFLNHGTYGDCHLLSPATVAAMTRNQIPGIPRELFQGISPAPHCGFGWKMISEFRVPGTPGLLSPQSYGHTGASGAILWVDPTFDILGVFLHAYMGELWPMDLFIDSVMGCITDI